MTRTNTVSTAVGAVLLSILATPSLAELVLEDIDPADPFGEINVDVAGGDVTAPALEAAQNAELKERCNLLIENPTPFAERDLQFCIVLLGRDEEGLTAAKLKEAAAAAEPAMTGSVQTQPSPDLGAEGVPEGNQ